MEYNQVPFDEYIPAVKELCRKIWPSTTEDYEIERLQGGAFNRVIGITAPDPTTQGPTQYVLRISRFTCNRPERELAIHRYVQEHTSIPTAEIISSDPTTENVLEMPYVVQIRLPGNSLLCLFNTLNHEQKKDIVEQWARVILELQAVKNSKAGLVETTKDNHGAETYNVRLWDTTPELAKDIDNVDATSDRTVLNMFLTQFKRWEMSDLQCDPDMTWCEEYYSRLSSVAAEMDAAGLFSDNHHHLCHCDLEARNAMVEVLDDSSAEITGILDWDSAVFAPIFVSCKPPMWFWAWSDDEEEDELQANDIPVDLEQRELKQIFEDIVGPDYLKYAYQPEYRLARKLFTVAVNGLRTTYDAIQVADEVIEDWAALKARSGCPEPTSTNDSDDSELSLKRFEDISVNDEEDPASDQAIEEERG